MAKKKAKKKAAKKKTTKKKTPKKPKVTYKPPPFAQLDQQGSSALGQQRIARVAEKIGARWGRTSMMPLHMAPTAYIQRLPLGILMFDWKSGGGIVIGKINRLWGPKQALKSTICLRALRAAQNHCRHCKFALVRHPECECLAVDALIEKGHDMGDEVCPVRLRWDMREEDAPAPPRCVECRCPNPRWWLHDPEDYAWLPMDVALRISAGFLPAETGTTKVDHPEWGPVELPSITVDPPDHVIAAAKERAALAKAKARAKGKEAPKTKVPKRKQVVFIPTERCEPWRCLYLDSERTIDERWVRANGVNPKLVDLCGSDWAEKSLATIEEAVVEREFDLIIIDSTSMLASVKNLEKSLEEAPVVASKANLMGRFVRRHIAACYEEGLTARYCPTVLCTSQVTVKNIGYGSRPYLGPTDGNVIEHGLALDARLHPKGYRYDPTNTYALDGTFEFEITKNKAGGSPGATGTIKFWVHPEGDRPVGDSDDLATVMSYARQLGEGFILEGSGKAKLTLFSDYVEGGKVAFTRVGDCEFFLKAHDSIYGDLRRRVLDHLMAQGIPLTVQRQAPQAAVPGLPTSAEAYSVQQ